MKKRKLFPAVLFTVILGIAVLLGVGYYWRSQPGSGYEVEAGFTTLEHAFFDHRSEFMTEVSGTVARILVDDRSDPRTQKFVIRLENGQSVLVVHDHVAARRVPVAIDDTVKVRGLYRWSETGGTVLFTEMDPSPRRRHGWVEHEGKRYQ